MCPAPHEDDPRPHVVILGGGFAGLYAARQLARSPVRITLIDKHNYHLFQPLLYQVATAGLSAPEIAAPLRRILRRQRNVTVLMAEVTAIDPEAKRLALTEGHLDFDFLLIATGATHSYFGNDQWQEHAPGLKSLDDALNIRRRILRAFEAAERAKSEKEREKHLQFVVIGAGPTGVELAGAISELARHTMAHDFRRFDPRKTRVTIVDAADRVLPPFVPKLSESARGQLRELGVDIRLGQRVVAIEEDRVELQGEGDKVTEIHCGTILWAAGVAAPPLTQTLGVPTDRAGRIEVENDLSLPGHPNIFAAGDVVSFEQDGTLVPGVAPAAVQMGRLAADNIHNTVLDREREDFRYWDKGSMATIGRSRAVADVGPLKIGGLFAWLAWLLVHIMFLIGFRNRFVVLFEWAWAYVSYQRSARVIFGDDEAGQQPEGGHGFPSKAESKAQARAAED